MAERPTQTTQKFARTNNDFSENAFPPGRRAASAKNTESINYDELISTLSQSYENRRAMQAFEWESIRRRGDVRTFN